MHIYIHMHRQIHTETHIVEHTRHTYITHIHRYTQIHAHIEMIHMQSHFPVKVDILEVSFRPSQSAERQLSREKLWTQQQVPYPVCGKALVP